MSYPRFSGASQHAVLPEITKRRLGLFQGGHYRSQNLSSALDRERCSGSPHVELTVWSASDYEKPTFAAGVQGLQSAEARPFIVGDRLGPSWTNHWVKVVLRIPKHWAVGHDPVIFEFDPNCEGLIYTTSGDPIHAITGGPDSRKDGQPGMAEDRRVEFVLPAEAVRHGIYECYMEVSVNAMFGLGLNGFRHQQPDMNVSFQLATADLRLLRTEACQLDIDFQILSQIATSTEQGASGDLGARALRAANEIMNTFRRSPGDTDDGSLDALIGECRAIAAQILGEITASTAEAKGESVRDEDLKLWAIGHCHIDTAWLWCYTHTQQKIARSWSTQVDLIKRYPDYHFAASSAQQYVWLQELYPSLYSEVKEQIAADRFHPVGGAWLEHDCLIPSGESLCRQYLYGQRYFERHFGKRCREAWLPDTFGYASQLPQILRLAGIDFFFTQKLSWNNINTFPNTTFNWVGLDGSQVLAHMTPVDSYNSQCNYDELLKGLNGNKNLGATNQCLMLYGNGDGGGGPTPRMLEKLERLKSASRLHHEIPSISPKTPVEFFEQICAATDGGRRLPATRGELYFELHRGIYTSQANIKKGNHELEKLLRDFEYIATIASLHVPAYDYPKKELDAIWKDLLLNQFHDVLPGTSIAMAIQDALDIYARRVSEVQALTRAALLALNGGVKEVSIVFDPYRLPRATFVEIDGRLTPFAIDSAGIGSVINKDRLAPPTVRQIGKDFELSNGRLRLTVAGGRLSSLYDLQSKRELIRPGPGTGTGGLMLYEDFPLAYDAWDAEVYHQDCGREIQFDSIEPVSESFRTSLICTAAFHSSTIVVTFSLVAQLGQESADCLQVHVSADWYEKHKFLKFALPVDVSNAVATFGTQYGMIERPTHRNTLQEQAKFEVFGHGWADLSETGYGVTLASAYKYGYSVEENTMRISLLRSATAPDPHQDEGRHDFSFAIIPHRQRFLESGALRQARAFVNPLSERYRTGGRAATILQEKAIYCSPHSSVVLDTVKPAEDTNPSAVENVVLRLYESEGGRASTTVKLRGVQVESIHVVNILEEVLKAEALVEWRQCGSDVHCAVALRGFEIKTLLVKLQK